MNIAFSVTGWADYQYWVKTDKAALRRLNMLINDCLRSPADGIGKQEAFRHPSAGYWSRRITDEHRLVHALKEDQIVVIAARHHY